MITHANRLTREQCAAACGLAPGTLSNYASRRMGPPFIKIGKLVSYDPADVERWMDSRTVRVGFPEAETA